MLGIASKRADEVADLGFQRVRSVSLRLIEPLDKFSKLVYKDSLVLLYLGLVYQLRVLIP